MVAHILQQLRQAGRTQTELARHLGLTHSQVSRLLNGKSRMRVETLEKIEAFLTVNQAVAPGRGGVREAHAEYRFNPPTKPKLTEQEKEQIFQELIELGNAYKLLPRVTDLTDEAILGYDEDGLPT